MKHKLITGLIAFIITAMLFTGCGADYTAPIVTDAPPTTTSNTNEDIVENDDVTKYYHEDGLKDFEFGDEIWTVEVDKQCLKVGLVHYSVVGQQGEIVEAVPYWANDVDYIREVLSYGTTTIYSFAINQIYRDQYDAMVAVAELNGETFEEYWGPLLWCDNDE